MPKAQNAVSTRKKHKRWLKKAAGQFGNRSRLYRYAIDGVIHAGIYAYRDRRKRKSEFRKLWIVRLNAACRARDLSYSRFINGLKLAGVQMDRKQLSELAIHDEAAFSSLVERVKQALVRPA